MALSKSSCLLFLVLTASVSQADEKPDSEGWSAPTNGLQARIVLEQKAKLYGTRNLVPYLELKNVSNVGNPMRVNCATRNVKFELINGDGKVLRDGWAGNRRSGPHAEPGTIVLPHDSFIRIGMYCSNWGVRRDSTAMIATDSGAWTLTPEEKGTTFLRVTVHRDKQKDDKERFWNGKIQAMTKIDWKEDQ